MRNYKSIYINLTVICCINGRDEADFYLVYAAQIINFTLANQLPFRYNLQGGGLCQ